MRVSLSTASSSLGGDGRGEKGRRKDGTEGRRERSVREEREREEDDVFGKVR